MFILMVCCLSACAIVGSDYQRPAVRMQEAWQAPHPGNVSDLTKWWATFNDHALDALLEAAQKDNPTLSKALAAIDKARAKRESAGASLFPQVNADASKTWSGDAKHSQQGATRTITGGLDASWELDLFGKNRRNTESAEYLQQAREADWHDARVSLAAEVATAYVDYRASRLKQKYYEEQAASQTKTTELTKISADAGFTAPADARLAEASTASTMDTALAQKAEGDVLVKTLVSLTGLDETELLRILGQGAPELSAPVSFKVTEVPADLLRQRPDIVSAERSLASTNALIGVAEGARYPSFSLGGSISLTGTNGVTTSPWSFGPTLSLPLFDGGKISADIKSAKADYASALATYQQAVRTAVKEVEQALVRLDSSDKRQQEAQKSAEGYRAYFTATEQNWSVGGASILDLETARRSTISAEVKLIELKQARLEYWVALYKAVGGGWKEVDGETK